MPLLGAPHYLAAAHRIMKVGGVDLDVQEAAQHVDDDMPLAPLHPLAAVDAARLAGVLGLGALRVDDAVAGAGLAPFFFRYRTFNSSNAASQTPRLFH